MTLFFKECKALTKSVIYIAFVIVVVMFYATQFGECVSDDVYQYENPNAEIQRYGKSALLPPEPGQDSYGRIRVEIPELIMSGSIAYLSSELLSNNFVAYPFGFGKHVKLNDEQLEKINKKIIDMTGMDANAVLERAWETENALEQKYFNRKEIDYSKSIPVLVTYDQFKVQMNEIDGIIGGGSQYSEFLLSEFGNRPMTYEEAVNIHNQIYINDKVTGAYARLFCDYMGIVLALFSVFVPVSYMMRDKRAKMQELIGSRGISGTKLIVTRYLAVAVTTVLPIVLLSFIPYVQLIQFGIRQSIAIDHFAFIKYIAGWLVPTVLFTSSVSFFFTVLTGKPIAIFIQFAWGFLGLITSFTSMQGGGYGIELAIRHNIAGNYQLMMDSIGALAANRLIYTILAMIILALTVMIYENKRKGSSKIWGVK